MEKSQKKTKQYEQFSRNVANLLRDFEKNREWADIGNWLSRLQPILNTKKFANLPHKIQLAKRLAQCLNPNLPAGIHSNTLSVYNTIFSNFDCKSQLLPLFSIGLFPFFEYSSSSLKLQLLKIFQAHYISTTQCLQMITSLMNTLLTGLNQNNEELAKRIYGFCDQVSLRYGRMWVDGAVWINVLKVPKVRIAGFKYFMKSFKDRDKIKRKESYDQDKKQSGDKNDKEKQESPEKQVVQPRMQEAPAQIIGSLYDSFLSDTQPSNEATNQIFSQLSKIKALQDSPKTRFPNFSTLVVNALSQCLESQISDTLVRRSALDLMIFYLRLDNKELMTEKDAIHLVCVLLQIIKIKEYSLTRRVYTYLFGQPNTEGIYSIDPEQRAYQLSILKISLQKLLKQAVPCSYPMATQSSQSKKSQKSQSTLLILQLLLKDHQILRTLLLEQIAFQTLIFLKRSKINSKRVVQFYQQVIEPSLNVFIRDLKTQIISEKALQNVEDAKERVQAVEYFYSLWQDIEVANKAEVPKSEILSIIQWLLKYLAKTNCTNQKISIQILQLCNKFIKFLPAACQQSLTPQSIELLNGLISLRPSNPIYAGLLTLHPHPSKQTLLPYMSQVSLSIVCITNLLNIKQQLTQSQKNDIFFAIFKLLNCHLWEDKAVQFIQEYKQKYKERFSVLIDQVQPSEWLIYWRKMSGDVDGGVIRMLNNLDTDNHINKQLSKKWLQNSKLISSKIVDPIYKLLKETSATSEITPLTNMKHIYTMIQRVFTIQKADFITFFFLQKERYFMPLVDKIFECINYVDEELQARSINMLGFLMERAGSLEQKLLFIQVTIERTVFLLRKIQGGKGNYQRQIQIIQYLISMVDHYKAFTSEQKRISKLKQLIQSSELYQAMSTGMKQTSVPYVRTLYIQFIQQSIEVLANVTRDGQFISSSIACVLQKLVILLRLNDVTMLEQIIKGKSSGASNQSKRKKSEMGISLDLQSNVSVQTNFNVQAKYAQVIELWNSVKFLVTVCIKHKIKDLPIQQLLSLILQSFPFSQIQYSQICPQTMATSYQCLQQQIKNMTGLKKQVLQIFLTLWTNYQNKIINILIKKGDPRVLIHGSVDPSTVIKAISNSTNCMIIAKYYKGNKFVLPKGTIHYNTQILLIQNQINYFLYMYLLYCNLTIKNNKKVNSFVESTANLLKSLKISTHVQTKIWILEILYCLYERIPFRSFQWENSRIKLDFQEMLKEIAEQLTYVIAKGRTFTHKIQIKTGFFNMFGKEQDNQTSLFDFVRIFPPTIHHMSESYQQSLKPKKPDNPTRPIVAQDDLIHSFLFQKWANLPLNNFVQYLSVVSIKTFCKILITLLNNVYENETQRISALIRDWLMVLFPLYENKNQENQMYLETVAQFLRQLLQTSGIKTEIIKGMRKDIINIFMGNDFFKCTKNTLNNWKYIIDCCTDNNYDLLGTLLSAEGLFDFFTRKAESTRLKIKNFERVCFVIYSGRVDKYQNKLRIVLQSLNQVMKSENPSPALLILILFCIRILFIRLSESALTKMFRSFWPSLITLLIQIYTKPSFNSCTNLLLAGLKMIELVHALQLEEFQVHKWIFVFDYFGIRIDSQTEAQMLLVGHSKKILTPFKINPILTKVLPQNNLKCTFLPQNWPDQPVEVGKRKLIVKQASIQSDEQLRNHALILLQYMIDVNQRRVVAVKQDIEDLIQADFISLDDYIFQVK